MLDHHHGSGIRLERFEHVGRIGEVTDVVAGVQQHRLIGRADISAAAAQHHMFHSAWRVGQRLAHFAGLHLEPIDIAPYPGRAVRQQGRRIVAVLGIGRRALIGTNDPRILPRLLEEPGDLQTHGHGQRPQRFDARIAEAGLQP